MNVWNRYNLYLIIIVANLVNDIKKIPIDYLIYMENAAFLQYSVPTATYWIRLLDENMAEILNFFSFAHNNNEDAIYRYVGTHCTQWDYVTVCVNYSSAAVDVGEKSPENCQCVLRVFSRPFTKFMENDLVFMACMFSISMSGGRCVEKKQHTQTRGGVVDFDVLNTSA